MPGEDFVTNDDILVAEIVTQPSSSRRDLNLSAISTIAISIVFLLMAMAFGESIINSMNDEIEDKEWWQTPLHLRHEMDLPTNKTRAQLPVNGTHKILPMTEHFVEVELPASEQDAGVPGPALMHVALWLPEVEPGTKVPVIMTIHPYYDFGGEGIVGDDSEPNTVPDGGVGKWVHEIFVPHGYALAQASTFGTGESTHCQDVKGLGEQTGIQAVVDWLGVQEWSNGNVGLMGKSYAGTTNWEAAQQPSEHLKTIVPISGSIGVQEMFYRNGSSESRAMLYDALYEGATTDAGTDDMRMCTDDLIGPLNPFSTWAGAEFGGAEWNDYWDERRHLPDVLENYRGSVYLVWGLQDWNVDPYHAFPTYQLMRDAGINARAIAGQWAHNYPDQPDKHGELESGYGKEAYPNMSRLDWAVELFEWFNYYLKDIGEEPEPMVQIQTNDGRWHVEETWPPEDMTWLLQDISSDWDGASGTVNGLGSSVTITSGVFEQDTHVSGLPTLHLDVTTQVCQGGQIFATLFDETANLRLGHATMDIRYRDGGYDAKPTAPASQYTMLMEFNPLDVIIPAGHSLRIELTETGEDYLPSPCATNPLGGLTINGGVIGFPIIDRSPSHEAWFEAAHWPITA
ncbi:MAG: CocE/NonD family hydrolase [Candidatus Poseidoniaceae archaeon]